MRDGLDQQYRAVASGYWPLIRYDPVVRADGRQPVPARLAAAADSARRLHGARAALPHARQHRPGRGRAAARPRRGGGRPALGRSTRRWRRAARSASPPTPGRTLMELATSTWAWRCATRSSPRPRRSPGTVDGVRRLADAGVGAIVLHSLFEEQLRAARPSANARLADAGSGELRRVALLLSRRGGRGRPGPRRYLSLLERAAAAVDVPVIAQPQRRHARRLDRLRPRHAGGRRGRRSSSTSTTCPATRAPPAARSSSATSTSSPRVKDAVTVPVAVKLSPYFSSIGEMALRARRRRRRRARALQPLPAARHRPGDAHRASPASGSRARPRRACRARGSRSCTAGCARRSRRPPASRTPHDVAKYLLAGADVVMTTSALLRHGPDYATVAARRPDGVDDTQGLHTRRRVPRPARRAGAAQTRRTYERAGYVDALRAANAGLYNEG